MTRVTTLVKLLGFSERLVQHFLDEWSSKLLELLNRATNCFGCVAEISLGFGLQRNATLTHDVLESADWDNFDESKGLKICVNAEALSSLKSYIEEK